MKLELEPVRTVPQALTLHFAITSFMDGFEDPPYWTEDSEEWAQWIMRYTWTYRGWRDDHYAGFAIFYDFDESTVKLSTEWFEWVPTLEVVRAWRRLNNSLPDYITDVVTYIGMNNPRVMMFAAKLGFNIHQNGGYYYGRWRRRRTRSQTAPGTGTTGD